MGTCLSSCTNACCPPSLAPTSISSPASSSLTSALKDNEAITQNRDVVQELTNIDTKGLLPHDYYQGEYVARVYDVYDGDTFTLAIKMDNRISTFKVRLFGVDCPELKGSSKEAGHKAREALLDFIGASGAIGLTLYTKTKAWFNENPIIVRFRFAERKPNEGDKYGRQLGHLYKNDIDVASGHTRAGRSLADYLVEKGLANPYSGGTKDQAQWEKE